MEFNGKVAWAATWKCDYLELHERPHRKRSPPTDVVRPRGRQERHLPGGQNLSGVKKN